MKLFLTMNCFFLLSLQDGTSDSTKTFIYSPTEGDDLTVLCPLDSSGAGMFFCRGQCEGGDSLIETRSQKAQSGRYSIKYDPGFSPVTLAVTISQVSWADSGRYKCGFGSPSSPTEYRQIEIIVVDALLNANEDTSMEQQPVYKKTGTSLTVQCSFTVNGRQRVFCKARCKDKQVLVNTNEGTGQAGRHSIKYLGFPTFGRLYVTISQLTSADSGWYWCGLDSSFLGFQVLVTQDSSQCSSGSCTDGGGEHTTMLSAGVSVTVAVILLTLVVLILCRRRLCKAEGAQSRGSRQLFRPHLLNPHVCLQPALYENDPPASRCDDAAYLSLHPATRDPDQTYSTLTEEP